MAAAPPLPAPGNSAGGPPSPPFEPSQFAHLLDEHPGRGASIIAAMRPAMREAQALAHAELLGVGVEQIRHEWIERVRLAYPFVRAVVGPENDAALWRAVFDPSHVEELQHLSPARTRHLIQALSADQQMRQAEAQVALLARYGFAVTPQEILSRWLVARGGQHEQA